MTSRLDLALVAAGAVIRTIVFLRPGSLWLDELALAHTIVVRDLARLVTEPLAYQQVAPAGFVVLQKIAVGAFGAEDLSFRLVPWLASLAALVVFWRVSVRLLPPAASSLALALFAASPTLIVYAGQAKQYSSDVAAVTLLLWAGIDLTRNRAGARRALAAGTAALLLSLSAVLAGGAIGLVLLWQTWRHRTPAWAATVRAGVVWTAAAAITVAFSRLMVSPETQAYMRGFWARGFPPAPWADPLWIPAKLADVIGHTLFWFVFAESWVAIVSRLVAIATLPGAFWLWRRDGAAAGFVLAPVAAAVVAASLHIMPLDGRTALWLAPCVIVLAAAGVAQLREWLPAPVRILAPALGVAVAVSVAIVLTLVSPATRSQDLRPVLERVAAEARPGDGIYVYYGARLSVRFYGARVGLLPWDEGACHRGDPRAYFHELDRFRGRRVWVVWTHALPQYREIEMLDAYLSSIGRRISSIESPSGTEGQEGAQALLYDLTDPVRLARSQAASHEILQPAEGRLVPCGGPANDESIVR